MSHVPVGPVRAELYLKVGVQIGEKSYILKPPDFRGRFSLTQCLCLRLKPLDFRGRFSLTQCLCLNLKTSFFLTLEGSYDIGVDHLESGSHFRLVVHLA
jgi:hypothetical protein